MNKFGGDWTKTKLDVLESYITFYLTALKNTNFKKVYIDCFAGSGTIELDENTSISGSAKIVLESKLKFDKYVFIESDPQNYEELKN